MKQIQFPQKLLEKKQTEGRNFKIEFHWIPISGLKEINVYPTNTVDLFAKINDGIQHFVSDQIKQ